MSRILSANSLFCVVINPIQKTKIPDMRNTLTFLLVLSMAVSLMVSAQMEFNMSNQTVTDCEGNFFDSGGFFDDYGSNENLVFTICPDEPPTCLQMEFIESNIASGDQISFFDGESTSDPLLGTYTGTIPPAIGAPSGCMTILFTSDFFIQESGWIGSWTCSDVECDSPPPPVPSPQDCINAIPVCQNVYFEQNAYQGVGNIDGEIDSGISCLGSGEMNDVWYVFTVQESGDLGFVIEPNVLFDDYDWAVYNLSNADCSDIATDASLSVSCNYSGDSGITGATGGSNSNSEDGGGINVNALIPVMEGETYVLNVSQFSASLNGYTLDFGLSTATIFDVSNPEIVNIMTPTGCDDNGFSFSTTENVLCASINAADFLVEGPGGPFTVTDVIGEVCAVGAEADNEFTVIVDPPVTATGDYTFTINASFEDQCGNMSTPVDPVAFFVQGTDFTGDVSDVSVCQGENAIVEVFGAGTFNFYSDLGVAAQNLLFTGSEFDYSDFVITDVPYTALITQIENGCETAAVPVTITVSSQADTFFPDLELCPYHDAEAITPATLGGTWSGEGISADGVFDPTSVASGNTYSITYTIEGDCGGSTTGSVVVHPELDPGFSDGEICQGDAPIELDDLLNPEEDGGFWEVDGVSGSTFDPSTLEPGTYNVNHVVADNFCSFDETGTLTIVSGAGANGSPGFDGGSVCEDGSQLNLDPDSDGGVWEGEGVSQDGFFDPDGLAPGSYEITYTLGEGNCTVSSSETVTIVASGNANFDAPDVCEDSSPVQLVADEAGGDWDGTAVDEDGVFDPDGLSPGNYNVTYTIGEGDCEDSHTETITVFDSGNADFDVSDACADGSSIQLDADESGGTWSGTGVNSNGVFDPDGLAPGDYEITYMVGDDDCGDSNTEVVTVFASGDADFDIDNVCFGSGPVQLVADTPGGEWDGTATDENGVFDPSDLAPGDYFITYTIGNGPCEDSNTEEVTVYEETDADFDDEVVCEDDNSFNMNPDVDGGDWTGPGVSSSGVFDPDDVGPGTYTLTYTVSQNGCEESSTGTVTVLSSGDAFFPAPDLCFDGPEFQLISNTPGGTWIGEGVDNNGMFDPAGLEPGFYEVTHIVGDEGCEDSHTGVVVIIEQISIDIDSGPECDGFTGNFNISFDIDGGGNGPYTISGDLDMENLSGDNVTFSGVGAGQTYEFTVMSMGTACTQTVEFTVPVCPTCNPDAGLMEPETIYSCAGTVIEAHTLDAFINEDAILIYALHTNPTFNEDEILTTNTTSLFSLDDFAGSMNTTYYVSAVVGTNLGGFVDYNDPECTDISDMSTPIVFTMPITLSAVTDCAEGTGVFSTTFTVSGGLSSIDGSSYTLGGDLDGVSLSSGESYTVEGYFDQDTYQATASDGSCSGSVDSGGPVDCLACSSSVSMPGGEIILCQTGLAESGGVSSVELGGYDLWYVVHDDIVNPPGNIVGVQPASGGGSFAFSELVGATQGVEYYITAVVAPDAGDGTPDLTHPCVELAVGPMVVWLAPVTFESVVDCDVDAGIYTVSITIQGGYPAYVPGEDYLVNLGGLEQVQLFASDLPYQLGPFVAGSTYEIYATDDWDCDQTGFVSESISCKAEECDGTFIVENSVVCGADDESFDVIFAFAGGGDAGYSIQDLSNGDFVITDAPGDGAYMIQGLSLDGGYNYGVYPNAQPECVTVFEGSAPNCTPTNIELVRFDGIVEAEGNLLYWITASEFESDYFELQRSKDGINWEPIAEITAAGYSNQQINYEYMDKDATGMNYYRLNEVDINGKSTISAVVALDRPTDSFEIGGIAPVPTSSITTVSIESKEDLQVALNLYDLSGRVVMQRTVELTAGSNDVQIDLGAFSSGIYMLNLNNSEWQINTKLIRN